MSWIDIAILAFVVLFGLIGILRGVKKSLLSLGAFVIAFVVAFFLSSVVSEALLGIGGVKSFVLGNGDFESGFSLANWIYHGLGENNGGLAEDSYLFTHFLAPINEIINASTVSVGFYEGRAMYIAYLLFSVICGVGIFLVARFLLMIVTAIVKSFIGKKKSVASRLTGFLVSFLQGGITAFVIVFLFTCFGGLTFVPGLNAVEAEFERDTVVFSNYLYDGAYYVRNKLYLPNAQTYGRIVNLVYNNGGGGEGDIEHLTGSRLELFIAFNNLNYENDPWSIDPDTKKRAFDEQNATALSISEFQSVGFDEVVEAILAYNTHSAAILDNLDMLVDVSGTQFAAYNGIVNGNTKSASKAISKLIDELRGYISDYEYGKTITDKEEIIKYNTNTLSNDYLHVCDAMHEIELIYDDLEDAFGVFPDLDDFKPERVSAGPTGEQTPPEGGEVTPPEGGEETPPEGGEETTPEGGEVTPPEGGEETTPPEGGEVTPPEGGEVTPPEGGEVTPPEGGEEQQPVEPDDGNGQE